MATGVDGALAVGLGAFGAHGLKTALEAAGHVDLWRTAAHYQFVHALALLGLAALLAHGGLRGPFAVSACLWIAGTCLFSGSLYALALGAPSIVGAITPIGGLCFLAGWLCLCFIRPEGASGARERNCKHANTPLASRA